MFKWILFTLFTLNLYALEVTISGAKENFQNYSTLHLKDSKDFLCQEEIDEYENVTRIVCAFATKPSTKFQNLQNNFFKISSKIKKKTFFLIIEPFYKMKLFPIVFNLSNEERIFQADVKLSPHWMVVAYENKLPFIKNRKLGDSGINFPFLLKSDMHPYVGSLDLKGNPVHIKKVQDVSDYLRIKKFYKEEKYERCLDLITDVEKEYPNSLFNAELLFYKIRVYAKLNDFDNVIEYAKIYLQEYSWDENVAEVLAYNAKAYSKIGLSSDADYFFDRLFSEHQESSAAKWGYIYKAEMLESSGAASRAVAFYEKALQTTKEIDIAVTAAYKLANYYLGISNKEQSAKYIMKIVKAKPDFFIKDIKNSMEMMYSFADEGEYKPAAAIAKAITNSITKDHDEYERLLKDRAIWLSQTDAKLEALEALNKYLSVYSEGTFDNEIRIAKDALFFDTTDVNATVKLAEYNELIDTYLHDTIGDRATYEKAKLLLNTQMYGDVLGFKDDLLSLDIEKYPDTQNLVKEAAIGVMKESLKAKECENVIVMSREYNITLSNEWDDGIYNCAMKGGDFILSKKIASKNLHSKDLSLRKKWLYRYIKVDFTTGNYSDVVDASKELIVLIEDDKNSAYKEVYRYLFDTYTRLEKEDLMLKEIILLEKVFGINYKDLDRYVAVMNIGSKRKDDNIVIKYAQEVVTIQQKSHSFAQSPFVEFTLYQSYINIDENEKALLVIKSLDSVDLKKSDRARQKYLLGMICSKLWRTDDAQKAYQESIDADSSSPWAKLAKSAKEIL